MDRHGVGDWIAGLDQAAPVVKLHPAIRTMIQFAARYAGQHVPKTVFHAVDSIAFFELFEPVISAAWTTAGVTEPIRKVRIILFRGAFGAAVDRSVCEALPEVTVNPLQRSAALATVAHTRHHLYIQSQPDTSH